MFLSVPAKKLHRRFEGGLATYLMLGIQAAAPNSTRGACYTITSPSIPLVGLHGTAMLQKCLHTSIRSLRGDRATLTCQPLRLKRSEVKRRILRNTAGLVGYGSR